MTTMQSLWFIDFLFYFCK